ncbi:nuclear transcription factor Y subunit C-1-like [Nicotiana sylvestris]|nr:PREDICTED: nuclear transcription factor Y subunit C-1-like [Nicotiana sylvestris]XP_016502099.1 PREDICTED: nuclear transcription factor Y subunit C-1-like [Nicotiana tabacum]
MRAVAYKFLGRVHHYTSVEILKAIVAFISPKNAMDNNPHQSPTTAAAAAAAAQSAPYPQQTPYHHLLQQQQQQLQMFWTYQRQEIEQANDFKNHQLPLARIKKIMKADEDVRMISAEAPILFAKACELFILELTIRSWLHAEENKRRTLQKNDIAAAITRTDIFDFLVDIVPRDEIKDESGVVGLGPGMVGPTASGVPYYYPPLGQPTPPGGVMMGRPAPMAGVDPAAFYSQPPSQAWQWQTTEDNSYASGGSSGQGNLDGQN